MVKEEETKEGIEETKEKSAKTKEGEAFTAKEQKTARSVGEALAGQGIEETEKTESESSPELEASKAQAIDQYKALFSDFHSPLRSSSTKENMARAVEKCRSLGIEEKKLESLWNEYKNGGQR